MKKQSQKLQSVNMKDAQYGMFSKFDMVELMNYFKFEHIMYEFGIYIEESSGQVSCHGEQ